jgi:glucosylceramidase
MGVSQPFSEVMMQNFDDCNDYTRAYTLQTSNDNTNWTQLISGSGSTPITTIVVPSTNARYIRIAQTGTAAATFWSIDEFYVLH